MEETGNADYKMFRFVIPYTDNVDMAKKILVMYNGYSKALNKTMVFDDRHMNLLSYYFVFGYSMETKKKFTHCFSVDMQYVSVLDSELRKRGILVDPDGSYRSRRLCDDMENLRRVFILENNRDRCACVSLFCRESIFDRR